MSALHTIKLSSTLALPLDVVTETIAVLGIRGSGKTNTCVAWLRRFGCVPVGGSTTIADAIERGDWR